VLITRHPTVFFLGINDCGGVDYDEAEPLIDRLMDAVHDLYVKANARNFLFVDLPPVDRSPQGMPISQKHTMS
jgi:hypothetical protein